MKFLIQDKIIKCTFGKFKEIREYMQNQNNDSDPLYLKIEYSPFYNEAKVDVKTSDVNLFI